MPVVKRDLLASCWTWAGDVGPGDDDQRRPVPLEQRLEAVATSGWRGVGIAHADLVAYRESVGLAPLRRKLERAGIVRVELEFLTGWWATDPQRAVSDRVRDEFLDAAADLGVAAIKVGAWQPGRNEGLPPNPEWFAHEFEQLADRADGWNADRWVSREHGTCTD